MFERENTETQSDPSRQRCFISLVKHKKIWPHSPLFSVCDLARYLKRHGVKYMTAVQLFVTQGQISVVHNHIFNVRRPAVQNFLSHDIFICYCYSISLKKQQPFPILPLKQKGGSPGRYVLTTYVLTHSPSSDISRVIWKLLILKYF